VSKRLEAGVERLFLWLDSFKKGNMVRAAYGEPRQEGGRTVIPVATVASGIGDWSGKEADHEQETESSRRNGVTLSRPLGVISVGSDGVHVHEVVDRTALSLTGMGLAALVALFVCRLLAPVLGRRRA